MKLEIKHLAIAFTNNWKVTYFDDERELNQVCNIVELREDECTISNGEYEYDVKFDDIKLLCFPISSLTKEITVNGKTFVPIDELKNYSDHKVVFEYPDYILLKDNYTIEQNVLGAPLAIIEDLYTWKFDVYGLIDKNLAEPVTEDFNPYK